jgi:hypothetical protein
MIADKLFPWHDNPELNSLVRFTTSQVEAIGKSRSLKTTKTDTPS